LLNLRGRRGWSLSLRAQMRCRADRGGSGGGLEKAAA
jgi:hypothetical protein